MSNPAHDVFAVALGLPLEQRADLAAELLRSLDAEDDAAVLDPHDVQQRWAAELTRRAERAIRGESVGRDADLVLRDLEAKLRAR